MPKFSFRSNKEASMFAYPPLTKPPVEKAPEKVETAVLSTTSKAKVAFSVLRDGRL